MKPLKRILLLALMTHSADLFAQAPPVQSKYKPESFTVQEVMIPMRDGVRLQTVIRTPKNAPAPLPLLFVRTPYGVSENGESPTESGLFDDLIADGYIFVSQSIRGRFKSEGTFVMQRPPRATKSATSPLLGDSDLAFVMAAWPQLPETVRAEVLATVKAATS